MLHDLRLALRTHFRRPMFALLIVMLLAIGVGANTFVLSLVEAVLLRPFEFNDQNRLTMLWLRDRTRNGLTVSTIASFVPALRAARLDPMQALRQE